MIRLHTRRDGHLLSMLLVVSIMIVFSACDTTSSPATSTPVIAPSATFTSQGSSSGNLSTPTETIAGQITPTSISTAGSGTTTLVAAYSNMPSTLDVSQMFDTGTLRWNYLIYEPLLEARDDKSGFIPRLAESWESSPDGTEYTFHLRKGVMFQDGTAFNADAVVYNIKRQTDPNAPGAGNGKYRLAALYLSAVKDVTAVDEFTVKFTLSHSVGPFLYQLTTGAGYMVSPAAVAKYGDQLASNPVGTGPFKLSEYKQGERLVLQANPDYWGGKPAIDNLIILPIADDQGRVAALRSGTVQFALDIPPDSVKDLSSDPNFTLFEGLAPQVWYLALNEKTVPAFKDIRVRQAMNYAVDKESIVRDVLNGSGVIASGPFSAVFGDWADPSVQPYAYDPDKAKQLLKDAGYANGFTVKFLVPTSGFAMQKPTDMAQVIKANLEAVGIKVDIETQEFASYYQAFLDGKYEMTPRAWYSNQNDPDNFLTNFFTSSRQPKPEGTGGLNTTYYTNPDLDKLIDAARIETDLNKRISMVHQAIGIIHDDAPWVFVDHMKDQHMASVKVKGIVLRGNGMIDFREATVSP